MVSFRRKVLSHVAGFDGGFSCALFLLAVFGELAFCCVLVVVPCNAIGYQETGFCLGA